MKIKHIGLACRSQENADRFYGQLLGLKKAELKTLPAAISRTLFNLNSDLTVLNYSDDYLHFEIFILEEGRAFGPPGHACLEVPDLAGFLERCRRLDVPVIRVPKGETWVTFIQDYDGNFFEIKEERHS